MARIALTGATGFIGTRLAELGLADGLDVRAFARRPWAGRPHVPLAERVLLTLPDVPAAAALEGVDAFVHLAAAPQTSPEEEAWATNVRGTQLLHGAALAAGVRRFVFVSSQSSHADAISAYGRSKHAAEALLRDDPRCAIVRPGLVYGDGAEGMFGSAVATATRLRAFPAIGGDELRAQLIHVDDLCRALLQLALSEPGGDEAEVVRLGDPVARPLAGLIREAAEARSGVRPRALAVPLEPVRRTAALLERVGAPSPIPRETLDGIARFRPMETESDLERLGLELRAFPPAPVTPPTGGPEPRRLLLVGAGRIGLVHALTARHHADLVLAGIADLDKGAIGRIVSVLGEALPGYLDLDQAIAEARPDVAIVATPPSTHLALARRLVAAGSDVLIEKPLTASAADADALEALAREHPERVIAVGYLGVVLSHVEAAGAALRAGRYGTPLGFEARGFVSRIAEGAERQGLWELDAAVSGGGALLGLGVHVLSLLDALLGPVEPAAASLITAPGRSTEDAAFVELEAGGVRGTLAVAWHLRDFSLPENSVRIRTDRGLLVVSLGAATFLPDEGEAELVHQSDEPSGFDLSPTDGGRGFWREQQLAGRHERGPNDLDLARRVEDGVRAAYARARPGAPVELGPSRSVAGPRTTAPEGLLVDLRTAPWPVRMLVAGHGHRAVVLGTPADAADPPLADDPEAVVCGPDIPGHFRTLTNRGPRALVGELGIGSLARAAARVRPLAAARASGRTWEVLRTLHRAELARLDRSFAGTFLLDAYYVDLATATGYLDGLRLALRDARRALPNASIGVETNAARRLAPFLARIGSQVEAVMALGSPQGTAVEHLLEVLGERAPRLIVKTGPLPPEALALAWERPERWRRGAAAVAVDWPAMPTLRALEREQAARAVAAAGGPLSGPAPQDEEVVER